MLTEKINAHKLAVSVAENFGFMPAESIITVWINDDYEITLIQRSNTKDSIDNVTELLAVGKAQGFSKAIFIMYSSNSFTKDYDAISDLVGILQENVEVVDLVQVSDGRTWSYFDSSDVYEGEEAVFNVTKTRSELIEQVTPIGEESDYINAQGHWIAFENHTDKETMRDDMIDAVRNVYLSGNQGVEESHLISVALQDVRVRDSVLWLINSLEKEELPYLYEVTASVCRDVYTRGSAALLTVSGIIAWSMRNGAKANICIDLALEQDPHYSLAQMIRQMLNVGMPPESWFDSVNEITYEESRAGVN